MKRKTVTFNRTTVLGAILVLAFGATVAMAGLGPPIPDAIWADGQLFRTILTPTQLPDSGPTNVIYNFNGQAGQKAVSEAKPGDADYRGGRWSVVFVEYTQDGLDALDADHDGQVDEQLKSYEEVQQAISDGFVSVLGPGPRFVCPMIPN